MSWGPFDLSGKAAIVTGAAQGIGFGIASRFVEAGADVLVADLDGDHAEEQAATLQGSGRAVPAAVDITEADAGQLLVEQCVASFGSVDILVNNAGIYPMTPMLELERQVWDRVLDVNITGLAFVSKAVAQRMVEQGSGGSIVNIASIDALHPTMVGLAAYDASKGAVVMFTKAFALEMAPHGVRVNAIAPGGIATEGSAAPLQEGGMELEQIQEQLSGFLAGIPLGRIGQPDDIAKVAVFLASSAADYMTGELLVVDGGALLS